MTTKKIVVRWQFTYECDKEVTLKEGDDIEAMCDDPEGNFDCPDFEEKECTEAYIWSICDDEGEEIYAV